MMPSGVHVGDHAPAPARPDPALRPPPRGAALRDTAGGFRVLFLLVRSEGPELSRTDAGAGPLARSLSVESLDHRDRGRRALGALHRPDIPGRPGGPHRR